MSRNCFLAALFVLFFVSTSDSSLAQFPYINNDRIADRLPKPFTIGNVLFEYRFADFDRGKDVITDLRKFLPPDRVVLHATPNSSLKKLFQQQLGDEQVFVVFVNASFANYGERQGYVWVVTWELVSKSFAMNNDISRYIAVVAGDGAVIEPQRYLYDTYPLAEFRQLNCKLSFADLEVNAELQKPLIGEEILNIAKEQLRAFAEECDKNEEHRKNDIPALILRLKFIDQEMITVPIRDTNEGVYHRPAWAVNFVDEQRTEKESDVIHPVKFTVWVTIDGRPGKLSLMSEDDGDDESEP